MKAAVTAIVLTMLQFTTYITIYIVFNVTLNITQGVLNTGVHYLILKDTLSKAVCLFVKLDAYMKRHPGEVDHGTSAI